MPSARNPRPTSGLLSGVLSFVSREIESFVTTATGGTLSEVDEPESPPSPRVELRKKHRRDSTRKNCVPKDRHNPRLDGRNPSHALPERHHPSSKRRARRPPSRQEYEELSASDGSEADASKVAKLAREQIRREQRPDFKQPYVPHRPAFRSDLQRSEPTGASRPQSNSEELSESDHSTSPSPPPPPRTFRRRQSVSMPGSLFPRSPSLLLDDIPNDNRHVRFESGILSPPFAAADDVTQSGPSRTPKLAPSVKAAVDRFHIGADDADPSILLPSPTGSPEKAKTRYSAREKGKGRAVSPPYEEAPEANTSGEVRVRGKERELAAAKADQRRRETRGAEEDEDLEREKARDKERIKMLEEEIARLKEELSKRPRHYANHPPPPPPPPPPPMNAGLLRLPTVGDPSAPFASARAALKHAPPPVEAPINPPLPTRRQGQPAIGIAPDKMAAFLTEMKTVRLRKVSRTMAPQPLRNHSFSQEPVASGSRVPEILRRSASSQSQVADSRWTDGWDPRVGAKRKRGDDGLAEFRDDLRLAIKRRSMGSSDSSFASTSSHAQSQHQSCPPAPGLSIPSRTWPPTSIVDAATPSLCSDNDMDNRDADDERLPSTPPIPPFRTAFRFRGDGIPVKPDEVRHHIATRRMTPPEIIDVDMLEERGMLLKSHVREARVDISMMPPPPPVSPHTTKLQDSEVFAKRPPTSPMPNRGSPVKPRPPARARPTPAPASGRQSRRRPGDSDEEVDPLSLSFEERESESQRERVQPTSEQGKNKEQPSRIPKATTAKPAQPLLRPQTTWQHSVLPAASGTSARSASGSTRSQNRNTDRASRSDASSRREWVKRRLTLDEELRDAGVQRHEDDNTDDLDSGVLVSVGTRSKRRGFLAHGGAGGVPVFMGVGYVDEAEDDWEHGDGDAGGEGYGYHDEDYKDSDKEVDDGDDEYIP